MAPEEVKDRVRIPEEFRKLHVKEAEDIIGKSITTGHVGNEMDESVGEFVEMYSENGEIVVNIDTHDGEWCSMAICFEDEDKAKKFEEKVNDLGGSLRLSTSTTQGWYFYEAE